jgi:hypothetical protein
MLILVFTHIVVGFFQSLRSSVMGGFDLVRVCLGSWILGFLGRSSDSFQMTPVISIKWCELCGLGT